MAGLAEQRGSLDPVHISTPAFLTFPCETSRVAGVWEHSLDFGAFSRVLRSRAGQGMAGRVPARRGEAQQDKERPSGNRWPRSSDRDGSIVGARLGPAWHGGSRHDTARRDKTRARKGIRLATSVAARLGSILASASEWGGEQGDARMKIAITTLTGTSPYSQSRHYDKERVPALKDETHNAYELRTWRNRMHVTKAGHVEIPGMAFSNAIKTAAKRQALPVPGKKGQLFGKFFESGVMVPGNLTLPILAEDIESDELFVPSDGRPGGGSRVTKYFPRIMEWSGKVTFQIFDDVIKEDVFLRTLIYSGELIGIGRFRPEKRGFYGRYSVESFEWIERDETELMAKIGKKTSEATKASKSDRKVRKVA